jgi:hypothetical protein
MAKRSCSRPLTEKTMAMLELRLISVPVG